MGWLSARSVGVKLVVLGCFATIAVAVPAFLVVSDAWQRMSAAKYEQRALEPTRVLLKAVQLMQQHRALSAAMLTGNAALAQARSSKEAEVTAALEQAAVSLGNVDNKSIRESWDRAAKAWRTVVAPIAAKSVSAQDTMAQHTAVISDLLVLVDGIADHFKLSMDADPAGFQLVRATVVHLPQFIETLGQLQARGTAMLTQKLATGQDNAEFVQLMSIAALHQTEMTRALEKVNAQDEHLKQALDAIVKTSSEQARAVTRLADKQIAQTDTLTYSSDDYFNAFSRAIEAQLKLTDRALGELARLQDARISAEQESAAAVLGGIGATFALALALGLLVSRSITRPLQEAVSIAQKVAAGDLTNVIESKSVNETGLLLRALRDMNESLRSIVTDVRSGTESMASASKQLASGNADLSQRTEEQASSLEETASSMEELTGTVKQNAENARQANQLAAGASAVAVKGGQVVGQVVQTMSSINDSSKKIADIIGVIDSIAFQTNILALNAAVEAARAGEQGRGFAVVAAEVRTLAQRSAAAAREIKALITDSVGKVDDGTKLVDQAGETMGEIVSAVKRVTDIMAEIAAASQEQTSGIEQVNQALAQMDKVTQQNAALVEEAAAAADSMREQAHNLTKAVAIFKLPTGDMHVAAVTRPQQDVPHGERRSPNRAQNVTRLRVDKPSHVPKAHKGDATASEHPVPKARKVAHGREADAPEEWQEF